MTPMDATDSPFRPHPHDWDVVVIGRSYAGLSAALMAGRARRSVLVVGTGGPRNEAVAHAHGLLSRDGVEPGDLLATAEADLARYPNVELLDAWVTSLTAAEGAAGFRVQMGDRTTSARFAVLATGVNDAPPPIPGLAGHWGRGVFTCPFCDGWEHRDLPLVVVGDPMMGAHGARMLRGGWSDDVTLIAPEGSLTPEAAVDLRSRGVVLEPRSVRKVVGDGASVSAVELDDGTSLAVGAVFCAGAPAPNAALAVDLGAEVDDAGFVVTDPMRQTTVDGLWAVGDVRTPMHQMSVAIADGTMAGGAAVGRLIEERVPPHQV